MARTLTPERFTFESFRHSQGDARAQVDIFGIFASEYGLEPVLEPTQDMLREYIGYISRSSLKTHLQYAKPHHVPDEEVENVFDTLRRYMTESVSLPPKPVRYPKLLGRLITQETTLLVSYLQIQDLRDKQRKTTQEKLCTRITQRIASGKTSFLHHYGLEGNSTQFIEFDEMYATLAGLYRTGLNANEDGTEAEHQKLVSRVIAHSNKQ